MSRPVFTRTAAAEYEAARQWHEARRAGRGQALEQAVEIALDRIEHDPQAYRTVVDQFRRILVRRFPYALFYRLEGRSVVIHAVFHTSQDPAMLRARLDDA